MKTIIKSTLASLLVLSCGATDGYEPELGELEQAQSINMVYLPGGVSFPDTFGVTAPEFTNETCRNNGGFQSDGKGCEASAASDHVFYPAYKRIPVYLGAPNQSKLDRMMVGYEYAKNVLEAVGYDLSVDTIQGPAPNLCWGDDQCEHALTIQYTGASPSQAAYSMRYSRQFNPDNSNVGNVIMDLRLSNSTSPPDWAPGSSSNNAHKGLTSPTSKYAYWIHAQAFIYGDRIVGSSSTRLGQAARAVARAIFASAGVGEINSPTLSLSDWHTNATGPEFGNHTYNTVPYTFSYSQYVTLRDD